MTQFKAPSDGIAVRMYRHGHGDCFLLAMPRKGGGDPVHVLIDCGYKPGSQKFLPADSIGQITKHIEGATGTKLDLVIITHEHQDHVNGFWKKKNPYFQDIDIQKAWLAWTESPTDRLAKKFRKKHKDQLLQLVEARNQMAGFAAAGEKDPAVKRLDALLAMEFGGKSNKFNLASMRLAASSPAKSQNKQSMKLIKDKAAENDGIEFLSPGTSLMVPGTRVRAYILGPPRRESLLTDEDPVGDEGFPGHGPSSHGLTFGAALSNGDTAPARPFAQQFCIPVETALAKPHFRDHYGLAGAGVDDADKKEAAPDASWRRIDTDWLNSAETLALKLNTGVNNTSLVVAFELPDTKRVLLFAGDAQRGNWVSWDDKTFKVGRKTITARDLLGRTVLYKVGHHGSHNATLAGEPDSDYPNLSWMGAKKFGDEFTAMITAVNKWALTKNNPPWRHPLPSIRKALIEKAQGRVLQTDIDRPTKPRGVPRSTWKKFQKRATFSDLYFDYVVRDD